MEESQIFEFIDNALQDGNKSGTIQDITCTMLSQLNLNEENEDDNLKMVQNSCDRESEFVLKNKLEASKRDLARLFTKKCNAEKELEKHQKVLTKQKKKTSKELCLLKELEQDCEHLEKGEYLNPVDEFRIEKYRAMNMMIKQCTGIRWDFTVPDNIIRGYAKNKVTGTLQNFDFLATHPSIPEKMWTTVRQISHPDWASFTAASNKENLNQNKVNK